MGFSAVMSVLWARGPLGLLGLSCYWAGGLGGGGRGVVAAIAEVKLVGVARAGLAVDGAATT